MDNMITENDKTTKFCFLCQIPCTNVCPHCRLVHYCNDEHFKLHRVTLNEEKVRITSTRDIQIQKGIRSLYCISLHNFSYCTGRVHKFQRKRLLFSI